MTDLQASCEIEAFGVEIRDKPEIRAGFLEAFIKLLRDNKRIVARNNKNASYFFAVVIAVICITSALLMVYAMFSFNAPIRTDQAIKTDVVEIIVSGNNTRIVEQVTGTTHIITSRRVIRRPNSPQPSPRVAANSETIRIITFKGVIVVHELQTGMLHII